MGSITIINKTNAPINSTTVFSGINSSWRNKINPNEFFVHSAAGQYTLKTRFYTSATASSSRTGATSLCSSARSRWIWSRSASRSSPPARPRPPPRGS